MKPTLNCKLNYLIKNYIRDAKIPTIGMAVVKFKLKANYIPWHDHAASIMNFSLFSNGEEIIDYMLSDTRACSCDTCAHQYAYKLTEGCNETYEPM